MRRLPNSVPCCLFLAWMLPFQAFSRDTQAVPTPSPTLSLEVQKKQLELERLELENEKLKLEMEKMRLEATHAPSSIPGGSEEDQKRAQDAYQAEVTQKAEALAKANKDKENILVVDFVNSEIWNQGIRYDLHEIYSMAEDHHWKMDRRVDERAPNGDPRYLYRYKNLSLLKYDSNKRGVLTLTPPALDGDFQLLTPEGITLSSSSGDVRNAYQSVYFSYDGQAYEGKLRRLKYIHKQSWNFSDRLEFDFDKEGKLARIRYGVLDEH